MTRYLIPPTPHEDLPPPLPTAEDVNIPAEAFGARTAFGALEPGEQLDPGYWDEANRANSTRAAELQNEFVERQRKILQTGPDAYLNKRGREAVLAAPDVLAQLEATRQDVIGQAANEAQRRLLRTALGEHRILEHDRVGTHAGEQSLEWQKQTATERLNQLNQQAHLDYDDPGSIEAYARASESAARERARTMKFGKDSDEAQAEVDAAHSSIWRNAIGAALGHWKLTEAVVLYDRAAARLTPPDNAVLAPQIEAAKEHQAGQAYLTILALPQTNDLAELDEADRAATDRNTADWPDNDSQRATNQHLIDLAFGQRKRDAVQAKAESNQLFKAWIDRASPNADVRIAWAKLDSDQRRDVDSDPASNTDLPTTRTGSSTTKPLFALTQQDVLSDATPEPVEEGRRYAQAGTGRPPRRSSGQAPTTPIEEMRIENFRSHLDAIRKLEPQNKQLSYIAPRGWVPTERDVGRLHEELLRAQQRAANTAGTQESRSRNGKELEERAIAKSREAVIRQRQSSASSIESKESGIGIGPYARESLPARSPGRNFNAAEHQEINRLGRLYGCHTCGTRNPGTPSGNFVLDHQSATRINPEGEFQILLPQCLSCSLRQGGLITKQIRKGNEQ